MGHLTRQHCEYIKARLAGMSQRQAYYEAYPASRKWTVGTVNTRAWKLESQDKIKVRINEGLERIREKMMREGVLQGADVIRELAKIGFSNLTDFVTIDDKGEVKITATGAIDASKLGALASIRQSKYGTEIKLHPKVQALTKLGEYLGLFSGGSAEEEAEDDGFIGALSGQVSDTWKDEE